MLHKIKRLFFQKQGRDKDSLVLWLVSSDTIKNATHWKKSLL